MYNVCYFPTLLDTQRLSPVRTDRPPDFKDRLSNKVSTVKNVSNKTVKVTPELILENGTFSTDQRVCENQDNEKRVLSSKLVSVIIVALSFL